MISVSAESGYRAMPNVILELIWISNLLTEIDFTPECPMRLYGDNKVAIHIAENIVFHERTKYIEVDCHIQEKDRCGETYIIRTLVSRSSYQITW